MCCTVCLFLTPCSYNELPADVQKLPYTLSALVKVYQRLNLKDKVLEIYTMCKASGSPVPPFVYEAYVNATLGYKPKKHRKKKE